MEKRPQFMKMTVVREENPPPRDIGCPDYKRCLKEAAFRNFCLDCSQCPADAVTTLSAAASGSH
ncbi:MAG: hypothetical protein HY895_10320 [Deltaproteobacteria bacterium]|nr:hypothetical protein [Deltaproteobacteria bacterium]